MTSKTGTTLGNRGTGPVAHFSMESEEVANAITHGLGTLLSIIGAAVMAVWVARTGDAWRILGCLIYGFSLVAVYVTSTLSHACSGAKRKHLFRTLDQAFIYLLIAGTYTPFSLAFLRTGPWWTFLLVMWSIAIFGFLSKILFSHRVDAVAIWIYVLLGWMPIVAGFSLVGRVPSAGLWWMLIGGLCYTLGTVFLIFDRHVRHFHALWHLFVIGGSACHFFVILLCVARVA